MNACLSSDESNENEDCLCTSLVFVDLKEIFYKHKNRSAPPNAYHPDWVKRFQIVDAHEFDLTKCESENRVINSYLSGRSIENMSF